MVMDPNQMQQGAPTPLQSFAALGHSLKQQPAPVSPFAHVAGGQGGYQTQSHPITDGNPEDRSGQHSGGTYGGHNGDPYGLGGGNGEGISTTTDGQWNNGVNRAAGGAGGDGSSRSAQDMGGYQGDSSVTGGASGGGVAGGQQSYNPGLFDIPSIQDDIYTGGSSFNDPNAGNIYGVINNQINNRANQAAPQLGTAAQFGGTQIANPMMTTGAKLDTGSDLRYGGAQDAQINTLAQIASGQGPSVAAVTAQQQRDQNIASSMAMLGSQRGASSAGLGLRQAAMGAASANAQASQQAALGRAQEATAAQAQLTGALSGARGQSQATATTQANLAQQADLANQQAFGQAASTQAGIYQQAGLANQAADNQFAQANQSAQLQQNQQNNAQYQAGLQSYMAQNQQDMASNQAYQSMVEQEQLQKYGIDRNIGIQQQQMGMQAAGSGIGALGMLAMLSDRRAKEGVVDATVKVRSFLDRIGGV